MPGAEATALYHTAVPETEGAHGGRSRSWPSYLEAPSEPRMPVVLGDAALLTPAAARTLVEQIAVPVHATIPAKRLTYIVAARDIADVALARAACVLLLAVIGSGAAAHSAHIPDTNEEGALH